MKEYIEVINRNLFIKIMKNLFWMLPIFFITNNLYIKIFGEYYFDLDLNFVLVFFRTFNPYCCLLIFGVIMFFAYCLETFFLPIILVLIKKRMGDFNENNNKTRLFNLINKTLGNKVSDNLSLYIKDFGVLNIYKTLCFIPVGLILWAFYLLFINIFISIFLFTLSLFIIYIMVKILNYFIYEFTEIR